MTGILLDLGIVLLCALAAWTTKTFIPYLKDKIAQNTQTDIANWIKIAVAAAEQIFKDGKGEDKFEYVKRLLEQIFDKLDYAEMKALIESEVYKLKSGVGE